jgi:hypothetical protein
MKSKINNSPLKSRQIDNAVRLGKSAMINGKYCIPWQDDSFMEVLIAHQESVPGSASFNELMEAWLTGWSLQNLKS